MSRLPAGPTSVFDRLLVLQDLSDYGLQWFRDIVAWLINWLRIATIQAFDDFSAVSGSLHQGGGNPSLLGTPVPSTAYNPGVIFQDPGGSNQIFGRIYDATTLGGSSPEMLVFGIVLLVVCVQGHTVAKVFNYGNTKLARRTRKSAWVGFFAIVTWYWLGVLVLYLAQGFTTVLIPDLTVNGGSYNTILDYMAEYVNVVINSNDIQQPGTGSVGGATGVNVLRNPVFLLPLYAVGALAAFAVRTIFMLRWLVLYVYLYAMPIGIALLFGNVPYVSTVAKRFVKHFFTWVLLPLPAGALLMVYDVLFNDLQLLGQVSGSPSTVQFLVGITFPVLLLWVTWKTFAYAEPIQQRVEAGAVEVASHVSAEVTGTGATQRVIERNVETESYRRTNDDASGD
ncbi:hypothetical protein [Haloarchaeobius iranensis]|uniref:Type IV secretion system protein TrbL n=1 Tax=Haloarchaeobius iranensis TaxID=996166 RepID=A0A1G9UFZ5_9EURY|nr:hypothetical protein [Haloarchaeobius iranensis]SDM58829.1 type IV secretion system protein TrbL [Haloarchaeobius iranensis]